MTAHEKGVLLTALGVLVLSPSALLMRLVSADPWTLLTWQGALMTVGFGAVLYAERRRRLTRGPIASGSLPFWSSALLFALRNVFFVLAITHTTVAHTLLIISTAPLLAALLSRLLLGEAVSARTIVAVLTALAGVGVMVSEDVGAQARLGDAFALVGAVAMAAHFTALRRVPAAQTSASLTLGCALFAGAAAPAAPALGVASADVGYLLLLGLVVMPLAYLLISRGPLYLPAAEANLLMLLETILGPYWVGLALGEWPSQRTLLAALIILPTLAGHVGLNLREAKRTALPLAGPPPAEDGGAGADATSG